MNNDCVIFVAAIDTYSDTWDIFFKLFFKYWPDCPFPIYLFSEKKTYSDKRVTCINIPEDPKYSWPEQWGSRTKEALKKIDCSYFIFLHTDYFLKETIDTARILDLLKIAQRPEVGCVRLCACPPPKKDWENDEKLGLISKGDDYSISFQPTLWRRPVFEKMLINNWGPVELEMIGSKQSSYISEFFLSVKKGQDAIPNVNGIKKGMWMRDAFYFLRKEGVELVTSRKIESLENYLLRKTYLGYCIGKIRRFTFKKLLEKIKQYGS